MEHMCFMDKLHFQKFPKGALVNRATTDVERIGEAFLQGIADIITDVLVIVSILLYIFYHGWVWGMITLSFLPVFYFIINYFRKGLKVIFRRTTSLNSKISARISECFSMLNEIKNFNLSSFQFKKFSYDNQRLYLFNVRMVYYESLVFSIFDALLGVIIALFFFYLSSSFVSHWNFGFIVAYMLLIRRIFEPIKELSGKITTIQGALGSLDKLRKIFSMPRRYEGGQESFSKGDIKFSSVVFSYDKNLNVLNKLSFFIPENSSVALVGSTGSGKTTIINLILRHYLSDKGQILIGGRKIEDIKKSELEQFISVIDQFPTFLEGSLLFNLRFRNTKLPVKFIDEVCKKLGLYHFIHSFSQGYDTKIESSGRNLSSGEKQLLAIIRAFIHPSKIIILDEASAHIDTKTETLIQIAISKLIKEKTTIIIAHRLSTIKKSDTILVLNKGKIESKGTHEELIKGNNIYKEMFQSQKL